MPTSGGGAGVPLVPGTATTVLTLIPDAAGHPLMGGPEAFFTGPAAEGTDAGRLVNLDLSDSSEAKTWTGAHVYVPAGAGAGQARRVQSVTLSAGQVVVNRPFAPPPNTTSTFWLLKHFSRNQWATFANQALREMRHRVVVVQNSGVAGNRRVAVPSFITRPEDIIEVRARQAGAPATGDAGNTTLPWFGIDNEGGTLILRTDRAYEGLDLLYDTMVTYAAPDKTTLVTDTDVTDAPRDWLVAECVALALTTLWSTASSSNDQKLAALRLGAAGRLVAGFRAKYQAQPGRRLMPAEMV